jgi:chloramphenicol O-acetyltransferase type A
LNSTLHSLFAARPLAESEKSTYLRWALDFFTDESVAQDPFVDITLQLDVSQAFEKYQELKKGSVGATSFFSFLLWNLAQTLQNHLCFKMRKINGEWVVLENAPIVTPVAVGGDLRFSEMLLCNVSQMEFIDFSQYYQELLAQAKQGILERMDPQTFLISCFVGNLPNLQFSSLQLHSRLSSIQAQPSFYFGKRYEQNGKILIPFAAKLHHACTDPYILDLMIQDFLNRFKS